MNYFIMTQDERIAQAVVPTGVFDVLRPEWLTPDYQEELEEAILQFDLKPKRENVYLDFLDRPIPLYSDRLKELIHKFAPRLFAKSVVLADQERVRQDVYWLFVLPRVACLSEQSEFHPNGALKRLVIEGANVKRHTIFQVEGIREPHIIIDLRLAEAMLRRDFFGIRLKKVEHV
ncbi:serine protease [Brevibacillus gelatini]|uniref:Serine protease n=1 Tax=Brevibacillus gelatini TaxID=1655277 RepID=A0A3M8BFA0_9BACL|nr:serine protease [Brevibacillus gelatini]RNB62104.1 serine protease [Brevibacillus gelatini]